MAKTDTTPEQMPPNDDRHDPATTSEYLLVDVEAVLAGTLALMTAMVQGRCEQHRSAIRGKVISNLARLQHHDNLSEQFRAVATNLQQHWLALDKVATRPLAEDPRLWHATPVSVQ